MTIFGTVKAWNVDRGYGFIAPDSGARDIFFHISALEAAGLLPPKDGDRFTFDIAPGRHGRDQAINLRPA